MTQTVAKECSWSRVQASKKVSGDLSLTLMDKAPKFSKVYSSGFVPDYRHAAEAIGESEGLVSPGHAGSEDSYAPKRRCISLNADRCDGFFIPMQVITLSKMSNLERKDLEMRLRRELELVQKLQKKILSSTTLMSNGAVVSSSYDPLEKKHDHTGQDISQLKRGAAGRFESKKQAPAPTSVNVLMKQCETLLTHLLKHKFGWVFKEPVDIAKLNIPDYFTVIKQPMDLGTIRSNLDSGSYANPMDFASHVRLTFSNAMTYNPIGNDVHFMAAEISKFFELRWKSIEKKLVASDSATKRQSSITTMSVSHSKKRKISQEPNTVMFDIKSKMTDEEKLSLSRRLSLIPELPQHIINFLKRHTDNADQNAEDEIEIDFDSLSADALFELKKLLDDYSKQTHLEQAKTEPCEIEILNESGLSNSSTHPCKAFDEDDDVDIGGNEPPTTSYIVEGLSSAIPISCKGSSSSSSSSESGSSSSDSGSGSNPRNRSNIKASSSPNTAKGNELQIAPSPGNGLVSDVQPEQGSLLNGHLVEPNVSQEGENAQSERQVSPDKLYRAALLRSRFADTILKAREKTLDQGEKKDPEKLRREREELERQQREERMRLQAEAKAAEDARKRAEEEAAFNAKRKRELEREAARQALLQMEKTVEINEGSLFLKDLEMLRTAPSEHIPGSSNEGIPDCSNESIEDFKLGGSNPLEQLGLYMKVDEDEEDYCDAPTSMPDVEEGEID